MTIYKQKEALQKAKKEFLKTMHLVIFLATDEENSNLGEQPDGLGSFLQEVGKALEIFSDVYNTADENIKL